MLAWFFDAIWRIITIFLNNFLIHQKKQQLAEARLVILLVFSFCTMRVCVLTPASNFLFMMHVSDISLMALGHPGTRTGGSAMQRPWFYLLMGHHGAWPRSRIQQCSAVLRDPWPLNVCHAEEWENAWVAGAAAQNRGSRRGGRRPPKKGTKRTCAEWGCWQRGGRMTGNLRLELCRNNDVRVGGMGQIARGVC